MAGFREHVTFSSLLGAGYGLGAYLGCDYTPVQATLAGCLAAIGGMLPDLDSPTGRPGQEIFALTAAVAPLVLIGRVLSWTGLPNDVETIMLLLVAMYIAIRYGVAYVVHRISVHRGMFHSIPAMLISGELIFLGYPGDSLWVKSLMAGAVLIGFFSHLALDEIYSVEWKKALPHLKKSSGTAIKMYGPAFLPNVFSYAALGALTYAVLVDANLIKPADEPPLAAQPAQNDSSPASPELPSLTTLETTPAGSLPPGGVTVPELQWEVQNPNAVPSASPLVNTAELDAPAFPAGDSENRAPPAAPLGDAPVFR